MEIFRLFGSILVDNDEANRSISGTERNAEGLGKRFAGGVKTAAKWGAAIAAGATVAAGAVVGMAKPLVEAAASAKAMEAQFGQVFDGVADSATAALTKISEETGMLPNRLKGSFTQMAAFAKTTGMETADALSLTERATLAAADSAAFYDKSIEEVSESLQSYLKGNFANDAALGIASTETTRNAKANELYSKSFKDLDEAQKQLTLLQMVEDGNKLSGALGQAALESDAFENQLGNLKQAWEDIKARFGEPILEPAVAMIQKLAEWLVKVDVEPIIEGFKSFASFINDNVVSRVRDAFATIDALYNAFMSVFYDTGEVADVLAKIGISPEKAQEIEDIFKGVIEGFTRFKEGAIIVFEEVKSFFFGYVEYVKGLFTGEGNIGESFIRIFEVIKAIAVPILEDAISFIKGILDNLKQFWNENGQQISDAVKNVFGFIASTIEFIMPVVRFIIEDAWNAIKNVIDGALNIIMGLIKTFAGLFTGDFSKMWEGVKQLFSGAIEAVWGLLQLGFLGKIFKVIKAFGGKAVDVVTDMVGKFKGKFDDIVSSATSRFNAVRDAIMKPINKARDTVKSAVDKIKGYFDGLKLKLPNIKTPSFKLENWSLNPVDWLKAMPKVKVNWNALGGIFTQPTIFNTRAGLQGVGEAGPEAILPLNDNVLGTIGKMIANTMGSTGGNVFHIQPAPIYLDGRVIAEVIFDTVDGMQYDQSVINAAVRGVSM